MRAPIACVVAIALAVSAPPATAQNATVSTGGGLVTYSGAPTRDSFFLTVNNPPAWLLDMGGPEGPGAFITAGSGCNNHQTIATRVVCSITGGVAINLDAGDDFFSGGADGHGMTINGGPGNDRIVPSGNAIHEVAGEGGNDRFQLSSSPNADTVDGGADDDLFEYPIGDDLRGGGGTDTVLLSATRPTTISVTLDDVADDGPDGGAKSNIRSDIENLTAGDEDDAVSGSAAANVLSTGGGNDNLAGGPGRDTLHAGVGDDVVDAKDGEADIVDCGVGTDRATIDAIDTVTGCEVVTVADDDHDGFNQLQDCNDRDASIRPGAIDTPGDGIDQNCDGIDEPLPVAGPGPVPPGNPDADGDGVAASVDCNDLDRAVHPGATDTPGDGIDQDCNGRDTAFPRVPVSDAYTFAARGRGIVFTRLRLTGVSKGARVVLACRGKGCARASTTIKRTAATVDLLPALRKRALLPGAVVEVRVTKAGFAGAVVRLRVDRGHKVRRTPLCLPPGAGAPAACPTALSKL